MRKTICALSFAGFVLAGRLNIGLNPRWNDEGSNAYQLSCDGAQGTVKYYVDNLPQGVKFDGNSIIVSGYAALGNYTITIKAVDQFGQSAERQITLTIAQRQGVAGGANGGVAGGAANGGVAGGNGGVAGGNGGVAGGSTGPAGGSTGPAGGSTGPLPGGATNPRLTNLITTYSSTETVTKPNYGTSGRYPTGDFPTAVDPNIPNLTPSQIASQQTTPTGGNRKPITADDVALRAASDRHQNASKGITNLLTIIDQARANRDKAQNDIGPYTQAYNDAVAGQRTAQNDIIAAETRVSQITTAISSLTATIDDLRNKINQAVAQNDALTREKNTIVDTIKANEGKKADLLNTLKGLDAEVAQRVKDLSDKGAECQSLNDAVNNKAKELADRQKELDNANASRAAQLIDINNKTGIVDDLRNKLQQAERDLADAKIRLADLDAQKLQLPAKIITLQAELNDLQKRAQACADQVARLQALINGLKGDKYPALTGQINDLDGKITSSRTRVSEIDAALAGAAGPLADLRAKLAQAQDDLVFVRTQKDSTDAALRNAYQNGNDANNRVAFARQNLDAIVKRFQDESKIVSDATLNLERARAEQALARQGLEELIAHYTDALPYAIVPNGNGVGSGTPNGNNPSGSPLGPVRNNGNGAPGAFKVGSWTNYLSTAYGAGVSPAYLGSVNELFPFNFLSGTSGNQSQGTNVLNNYPGLRGDGDNDGRRGRGRCGAQNVARNVVTGVVVEVRADGFDVRDQDGKVHNVAIAPCTQLNANVANYKVVAGHKAVAKGWVDNDVVQAEAVTCVQ